MVVECTCVAQKLVHRLYGHRRVINERFQQSPLVRADRRLDFHPRSGLRNIKDFFHVVGRADGAILPPVLIAGFQDRKAFLLALDGGPGSFPTIKVLDLCCRRLFHGAGQNNSLRNFPYCRFKFPDSGVVPLHVQYIQRVGLLCNLIKVVAHMI